MKLANISPKPHEHECPACGQRWHHDPEALINKIRMLPFHMAEKIFNEGHKCPNCGTMVEEVYQGRKMSHCYHDGLITDFSQSCERQSQENDYVFRD